MLKIWFYITGMIKYFIILCIITAIVSYIFPFIGFIVFVLGFLALNSMAKDNVAEKYSEYLKNQETKRLSAIAANSKDEFDGFDDALTLTRRNMM